MVIARSTTIRTACAFATRRHHPSCRHCPAGRALSFDFRGIRPSFPRPLNRTSRASSARLPRNRAPFRRPPGSSCGPPGCRPPWLPRQPSRRPAGRRRCSESPGRDHGHALGKLFVGERRLDGLHGQDLIEVRWPDDPMREEEVSSLAEEKIFQLARLLGLRVEFPEMDHLRHGYPGIMKDGSVAVPLQMAAKDCVRFEGLTGLELRSQIRQHESFRIQRIDRPRGVRLAIFRLILLLRERRLQDRLIPVRHGPLALLLEHRKM
jgi:hypothetical protein